MKRAILSSLVMVALGCIPARAAFTPIALTPGSFNADVIVEATASKSINDFTTITMEGGTNNTATTWYETGYNSNLPWSGIPLAGSTFVSANDPLRSYKMPPSYTANNGLVMTPANLGPSSGTLTLATPTALSSLSIMGSANGATVLNYTVHHAGGADQTGTITILDWFNATAPICYYANGRINLNNGNFSNLGYTNAGTTAIHTTEIALTDTVNPVTSIDFSWNANVGRACLFGVSGSTDNVNYSPVDVTGFNKDIVVEASAPKSGFSEGTTATMEAGMANTLSTFFERGFYRPGPTTSGMPVAGTTEVMRGIPFLMPPTYTTNNAFFVTTTQPGFTTSTINFNTPTSASILNLLTTCSGNSTLNVAVNHVTDPVENFTISITDWTAAAAANVYTNNGRYTKEGFAFAGVGNNNVRLSTNNITLASADPVTSINITLQPGNTRAAVFAVTKEGATTIPVSGFNQDVIVEKEQPYRPAPVTNHVSVTMDGGTNKTGSTWYEQGYYTYFPTTGFPAAGSTIASIDKPDHSYTMSANYAANNAVYVDQANPTANMTIASPANYSALSFLSCTANGTVTNRAIMQFANGTSETNTFVSRDWFNQTPVAYYGNGRVQTEIRTIESDPGRATPPSNPRLYEAEFSLGNISSPVTNVVLQFLNGAANARVVVFAASATAGPVPPIVSSVSISTNRTFDASNIVFNAVISGGATPITYQWQRAPLGSGTFTNLPNGGSVSGATTTNMVITATPADVGNYRLLATNAGGSGFSATLSLERVVSPLPDVTAPGDTITVIAGSTVTGQDVTKAIDNTTSKYFNNDGGATPDFDGPLGFVVKPSTNTIVSVLRIYTADDVEDRDPADYVLEGSLDGSAFTTISSGSLALPSGRNAGGSALNPLTQNLQEVRFINSAGYAYYKLTFNNLKNNTGVNAMQVGEVELLGVANPTPPPSFVISPADTSANEGTTATFASLAVGPAPLTYQWYDVTGGDPGTLLSGETNPNLALASVTAGQSGNRYRVVASNTYGSVTNPSPALPGVLLTVYSGPVTLAVDLPAEALFYANRSLTLSASFQGTAPAYQWLSNGVNMVNGGRVSGADSDVLTISNLQLSDAAVYQLQASNYYSGSPYTASTTASSVYVTAAPDFHTNGVGWAFVNSGGGGSYFPSANVLALTYGNNQGRAAWFATKMNISAFQASFIYQDVGGGGADGAAFVIQNSAAGTNALGAIGGAMGYNNLNVYPSAAVVFRVYPSTGIAYETNGVVAPAFGGTSPVDLAGGDPIQVNLSYDGSTLRVSLSNITTSATFTTNFTSLDLPGVIGTNLAYVGITAATGGLVANQQVSDFRFVPIPTINSASVDGNLLLTWPGTIGGYRVDVTPDLPPVSWSTLSGLIDQTNGTLYRVIAPTGSRNFYRLSLP